MLLEAILAFTDDTAGGIALSAPRGRPGAQGSGAPAPVLRGWVPSRKGQSALQGCPRQAEPLCPAHSARAGPAPDVKRCREGELSETRATPWPFLRVPSGAKSDRDALRAEEEALLWVKEGSGHEEATSSPLKGKQGLPAAPGERAVPDPTGLVLQLPTDPGAAGSFQTLLTGFGGSGLLTVSPRPSRQEMGRGWASLPGASGGAPAPTLTWNPNQAAASNAPVPQVPSAPRSQAAGHRDPAPASACRAVRTWALRAWVVPAPHCSAVRRPCLLLLPNLGDVSCT
ncbi:collagen alpha-1(III) chain-like [Panthera pardus]|uniref:Collagen alpha-1(III) chain-like n=1 Tax=Panthera pardus TaxID=9691 RepID=A0A9W2VZ32_PANPR|nr:collagen alpha-1(III) chain-like [Panthera pardus]